jgi:polar amino acid transport system substrate-binding protein
LSLSLLLALLTGCSSGSSAGTDTAQNLPELKIGIDSSYEPYTYVDEHGNYAGLDIDLATEACARMGRKAVFVPVKWEEKNDNLKDGSIDVIWSCFSMNGREEDYDWVGPYMNSRQVVAVRSDSDIETLSDLEGLRVGVMSSTKPESIFLERTNENIPDLKAVYCLDDMDLVVAALENGYVNAVAGHETAVRQYTEQSPGSYRLLDEELLSADIGVAFEKGQDADTQAALTQALDEMRTDGTLQSTLAQYGISMTTVSGGVAQ